MPIAWTPDNNAKLFLAVLEQLKDHKLKLDNKKLAEYMGPDCSTRAVEHQILKFRKQANQDSIENSADASAPTTPKKSTPAKKKKVELEADVDADSEEMHTEIKE